MQAYSTVHSLVGEFLLKKGLAWPEKAVIEPARDPKHGDLATNVAMLLAKPLGKAPREVAAELADFIRSSCEDIVSVDIAGPGFCNITFAPSFWQKVVSDVEHAGVRYGNSATGAGKKTLVEYVSANPTGPLHVGHGRGAACGDSLARILRRAGYDVTTEYYINDAGRQMRLLGLSVWYRLRNMVNRPMEEPADWYRGEYIKDIAQEMLLQDPDLAAATDEDGEQRCYEYAKDVILEGSRADLAEFRVEHQNWFSEKSLFDEGKVEAAFQALDKQFHPTVIDLLAHYPRAFLVGGAGTGKTWIAIKKVQRCIQSGQSALYLCYNKALAEYVRTILPEQADCWNIDALAYSLLKDKALSAPESRGTWRRKR